MLDGASRSLVSLMLNAEEKSPELIASERGVHVTEKIRSVGFYELPVPIAVSHDVLGSVFPTLIGGIPSGVHAPLPWPHNLDYPAQPPRLPGVPIGDAAFGTPWDWAMTFAGEYTEDRATCIRRLGIVLNEPEWPLPELPRDFGMLETRLSLAALEGLDTWFDCVRTWIEVVTNQDLDHHYPRYDVTYPGDGFQRFSNGVWLAKELPEVRLRAIQPIDVRSWQRILDVAGRGYEPPLEHLIARDARAAFQCDDLRRAAIDIGTVVEIVLNGVYRESLPAVEKAGLEIMSLEARNLRSLKDALARANVVLSVSTDDLDALIVARNIAAHEGQETHSDTLQLCLETMTKLLHSHGRPLGLVSLSAGREHSSCRLSGGY